MANLTSTWKTYLQAFPSRSLLSLKSLWELIYADDGSFLIDNLTGCTLDHDIICYVTAAYPNGFTTNSISYNGSNKLSAEDAYENLAIDVSIAKYDNRTKPRIVECAYKLPSDNNFRAKAVSSAVSIFRDEKFKCYDKNSALKPANMVSFVSQGVLTGDVNNISNNYTDSNYYHIPNVAPLDSSTDSAYSDPIYLVKSDNSFKGTLSTDTTISAYNLIALNPYRNLWTATLVLKALYSQIGYSSDTGGFLTNNIANWITFSQSFTADKDELINFVFKSLPSYINSGSTSSSYCVEPNSNWADLLKHTFVWVKAPFFGDYIQPDVFNQDLSQTSNVIHKNIIISNTSDFNKYDETTNSSDKPDVDTYPYIPVTSPTIDLITPKLISEITCDATLNPLSMNRNDIDVIVEEGDKNEDSKIGSLNFAPALRDAVTKNTLPNYFDPEWDYNYDQDLTKDALNNYRLPTLIPSGGNIYADGRIISPTIDELWVYLKQLTEGRRADTRRSVTSAEEDSAYAINDDAKYKIYNDTILSAASNEYQVNSNSIGDITGVSVVSTTSTSNASENKISVNSWVNNNKGIKYNIFQALNRISDIATKFDETRKIDNFTPWKTTQNNETNVLSDKSIAKVGDDNNMSIWQPRATAPYSLRELEALLQGNKYNLITLARFIENNFSVVGPLGYKYYKDETTNDIGKTVEQAAGSLYQFHRDYNYRVDNPNTFFRKGGEGKALYNENGTKNIETSGVDASFYDLQASDATPENGLELYNSDDVKTSKMPLLVANYGKSVYLDTEFGDYTGADIYMAADGTWRYKSEHSRVPILRSRY